MMSVERARQFAERHFPTGPENLAEKLHIKVAVTPLIGCDGWVLSGPAGTIIRLNSKLPASRRRFTLAHELGHLLLGVPTVIGESVYESLQSKDAEERQVNDLASELLLPESIVRESLPVVPVVAGQLRRLAKRANVSELAVAIRVANLAKQIGLVNGSVVFFHDDELEWHWSKTLRMQPRVALNLLKQARKCHPRPARIARTETNDVVVASLIENLGFGSVTLFVQLLPADVGNRLSQEERRHELEQYLFGDDNEFRMQLQGVFGAFRPRCKEWDLDIAVAKFFEEKAIRWQGTRHARLHSAKGKEYVRLRLREWCS